MSAQFIPGGSTGLHSLLQAPNTSVAFSDNQNDDSSSPHRIQDEASNVSSISQNLRVVNNIFGLSEDLSRGEQLRALAQQAQSQSSSDREEGELVDKNDFMAMMLHRNNNGGSSRRLTQREVEPKEDEYEEDSSSSSSSD